MNVLTTTLLFLLIVISGCGMNCVDKKTGSSRASQTLDDAKRNEVFQFEMTTDKTIFTLDSGKMFEIANAWIENRWSYECIDNEAVLRRDTSLQLVIEPRYNKDVSNYSDYLLVKTNASRLGSLGSGLASRLDFYYSGQDTFVLVLAKKPDQHGNISHVGLDTIHFTRK